MNRRTAVISIIGWALGLGLFTAAMLGFRPSSVTELPGIASAGDEARLTQHEAVAIAAGWAAGYVADTIGQQVHEDGRPVTLTGMELVDLRFVKDTRQVLTSIESGSGWSEERDVWAVSWERSGVDNVTTGRADGTAYVIVVVDDSTGRILSATASVRQPEDQARARHPLPPYEEVFPSAQRQALVERSCPPEARHTIQSEDGGTIYFCR